MTTKKIPSFDGVKLYAQIDEVANPKAVVLIVHGLAEHLNRYDALTTFLNQHQYTVYRYDQRGHARSEGQRVFYSDFNQLPDDCKTMVDLIKIEQPNLPIYLIGHSMGGFTVAAYGTKYPQTVNGIVTSGALTRMNHNLSGDILAETPDDFYTENALGDGVCSDPAVVADYQNDPLVEKEISVGLMRRLGEGVAWLKQHGPDFVDPVLILHGADDGLVSEKDSRDFFGDIASEDKTLKIYAKLYHEIFNEPVKEKIYTEVVDWLDAHLG